MDRLKSRVAYLQGLAKGLDVTKESSEGKLLSGILDVLEDIALEVSTLETAHDELEDYVDAIDEDLASIEEDVISDGESYTEIECSSCGETVVVDDDVFEDDDVEELTCPKCGETIYDGGLEIEVDTDEPVGGATGGKSVLAAKDHRPKE